MTVYRVSITLVWADGGYAGRAPVFPVRVEWTTPADAGSPMSFSTPGPVVPATPAGSTPPRWVGTEIPIREQHTMKIRNRIAGAVAVGAMAAALSVVGGGVAHAGDPYLCAIKTSGKFYVEAAGGGGRATDVMYTDQRGIGVNSKFKLEPLGGLTYGLKTPDRQHYVTAENSGGLTGANTPDVLHTNATILQDWEKFTLVPQGNDPQGNEIWGIKAFDGHYLTAIDGGGHSSYAFNSNATTVRAWEQFTLECGQ
jgi:hypothetical protein